MEEQLRDGFFHGLKKPIKDSLRYLFDNAKVGYAQLLIAARKNGDEYFESKMMPASSLHDGQELMTHDKFKALTEQVAHSMAAEETKGGNDKKGNGRRKRMGHPLMVEIPINLNPPSSGKNANNINGNLSSGETLNRPRTNRANSQCYRCKGFGHLLESVPPI